MQIDTDDLVSATELSRNSPWLLKEASEGRRFVIVKGNTPTAALISIDDLKRLAAVAPSPAVRSPVDDSPPRPIDAGPQAFLDALGIDDVNTWEPRRSWGAASPGIFVPIGLSADGLVMLDLGHSGQQHGFIGGMTGSGKSSCITAIVLALCARYSPDRVQIAIAGDNAERTFGEVSRLPHVSVFNEEKPFTDWATGVLAEREAEHGDRAVIIVVDENHGWDTPGYTDLLDRLHDQDPDSGIHVLLASQKPPTRTLIARMNYRLALRVRDPATSRAIIGSAGAAGLGKQGDAYLVRHTDAPPDRLQVFYPGELGDGGLASRLIERICEIGCRP